MTWGSSALSEHGQIKKKGYDWDQEFDVGCKITKTTRHPNGTRLRIKTAPSVSCLVLLSRGLKPTKVLGGKCEFATKGDLFLFFK